MRNACWNATSIAYEHVETGIDSDLSNNKERYSTSNYGAEHKSRHVNNIVDVIAY